MNGIKMGRFCENWYEKWNKKRRNERFGNGGLRERRRKVERERAEIEDQNKGESVDTEVKNP